MVVADKVLLALPLALVTAAFAAVAAWPTLARVATGSVDAPSRRRAAAGLFIAGYGSAAGLLVVFVVGYPVDPVSGAVVVLLVGGLSGLTWLALGGRSRPSRSLFAALVLVTVVPLPASAGIAFYRHLQPVVVGAAGGGHHVAAGVGSSGATRDDTVSVADLRTPVDRSEPDVRVALTNQDIEDGVTVHWHGYLVPNGEDGVAGVTQDAVAPGGSFTYRFVASDAGTYWYHAHQVSSEAVRRGLFGMLVVEPSSPAQDVDLVVPVHTFDGIPVVGSTDGVLTRTVAAGEPVRVRLINTDPTPHRISVEGTSVTVTAVDGTDLLGPTPIGGQVLRIPAGGRYDVAFQMPDAPVAFAMEGAPDTGLRLSAMGGVAPVAFVDGPDLDLLSYGTPTPVPGITDAEVTREATLALDRQFRFLRGIPTLAQTINGEVHPFVPPIPIREGDLLRLTVVNRSGETHPMHPHGHRVLVESRNGEPVRGSPLWLDTFDVQPGEVWTVLLRADNPGIWMSHCHNLNHATQGMVVHLAYEGVTTPYELGGGPADNRPE